MDPRIEASPGLLPRLVAGPATLGRSSRRLTRTCMFMVDVGTHVRRRLRPLTDGLETSRRQQGFISFAAENFCSLQGVDLQLSGELPRGPSLLVANHVSYLDPLMIMSVVPSLAIAKQEVASWPVVGDIVRDVGLLLLDRSCAHSGARALLRTKTLLERGVSVLTFPEGTTSEGRDVLPFKRGMFGLARRLGAPLVPIALRYTDDRMAWVGDASFLPHYLRTCGYPRISVSLELGRAVYADPGERPEVLAERIREQVRAMIRTPET